MLSATVDFDDISHFLPVIFTKMHLKISVRSVNVEFTKQENLINLLLKVSTKNSSFSNMHENCELNHKLMFSHIFCSSPYD